MAGHRSCLVFPVDKFVYTCNLCGVITRVNNVTISAAERRVMDALWASQPLSAEQIADTVTRQQDWTLATVKTLVNRLLKKGAITATRDGRRYLYAPVIDRDEYVHAESRSLVDRLFGGRLAPLVSHFSERRQLSKRDIAELKQLLKELERER
jgi:BlaI family transcriptional regulator, penicillinase repressor